jgi:hypothetical protein
MNRTGASNGVEAESEASHSVFRKYEQCYSLNTDTRDRNNQSIKQLYSRFFLTTPLFTKASAEENDCKLDVKGDDSERV